MKLRNRLYKHQLRSHHNLTIVRQHSQNQQRQFQKQLQQIQYSLEMMNTAFKNNIKIQEIYLDLMKARTKNINIKAKDIKNVYETLSENKTGEVNFAKLCKQEEQDRKQREDNLFQANMASTNTSKARDWALSSSTGNKSSLMKTQQQPSQSTQQRLRNSQNQQHQQTDSATKPHQKRYMTLIILTFRRLYSRLIESIVKKLTYYILNKTHLHKIILHTVTQITKRLQTLMRRLMDFKDFRFLFDLIRLIYEENLLIEQKIYEVLVNEGHVISIDQFFRINGILMEEAVMKRNSRLSVSHQRFSISSKDGQMEVQADGQRTKDSRFYENTQKLKSTKKIDQEKSIVHIEKLNKEIQSKYASALDKLGDLIGHQEETSHQIIEEEEFTGQNQNQSDLDAVEGSEDQSKENQQIESPYERWKRENQKKKSINRRRPSNFKYFSSEFKEIIKELDEKKGKMTLLSKTQQEGFDKTTQSLAGMQSSQFQKINNETISLQNPVNVARLLSKKFNKASPSSTAFSFMGKTGHHRGTNQPNQINKLLKIYENTHKQNHVIDILFNTTCVDSQHEKLQKNFIKINLMAKMKEQRFSQLKGKQLPNSEAFEDYIMREIEQEYEKLLALKLTNKKKRQLRGNSLNLTDDGLDFMQEYDLADKNTEKKRKAINLEGKQNDENLEIDRYRYRKDVFVPLGAHVVKQKVHSPGFTQTNSQEQLKELPSQFCKSTPIQLSKTQRQLLQLTNTFKGLLPSQFNNMNTIYNEFTNPLTKSCGYYNVENYTSLRNSLEKCEVNSIKVNKGIDKKNRFEIGSKVAFWNNRGKIEGQRQNSKKTRTVVYNNQTVDVNGLSRQPNFQKPFQPVDANIFQHTMLKKHVQNQLPTHLDGEQIMKPKRHYQKQTLNHSPLITQRNSTKPKPITTTTPPLPKDLPKVSHKQRTSLGRDFCLHSQKLEQSTNILNSDDMDLFIERYLQKNRNPQVSQQQQFNEMFGKPEVSTGVTSVVSSPRGSVRRMKEMYSTQRRVKVVAQ